MKLVVYLRTYWTNFSNILIYKDTTNSMHLDLKSYFNSFMQYFIFGSLFTIGAMVGEIVSGIIAYYIGQKGVSSLVTVT